MASSVECSQFVLCILLVLLMIAVESHTIIYFVIL